MNIGEFMMGGTSVFTPWFPRDADNAYFTFELVKVANSATFTATAYHKNTEDTGDGTAVSLTTPSAAWSSISSNPSLQQGEYKIGVNGFAGFDEMVRFKLEVDDGGVGQSFEAFPVAFTVTSTSINWIIYRALAPNWFNTPNA